MDNQNRVYSPLINGLGGNAGFGENFLGRNDDESTQFIDISSVFEDGLNYFGINYQGFYINNNGNITFNAPLEEYTPFAITGNTGIPIIAPFFADVDTRPGYLVTSPGGNSIGSNLVYWDIDPEADTVTITWDDVGQYIDDNTSGTIPNAFQLVLRDLGAQHFHMEFRYEEIQWTVGGASGNEYARIGYSAANGENFLELPQSGNNQQLLELETASNIEHPGRYIFSVINGIPQGIEVEEVDPNQPKTELASVADNGSKGNNNSENAVLSADGRYVVFESYSDNLVSGDNNLAKDIFVRDLVNDTIKRVSISNNGVEGNHDSENAVISADGRYIAFESTANNFDAGDTGFYKNVFVHDLVNATTELVSRDLNGSPGFATNPSISADGRFIAFRSSASNLVSDDKNNQTDIFVHDLVNDTTQRVSLANGGFEANNFSWNHSISADGRYVVFESNADNLVPGDINNITDIFIRDLVNGTTEIVSVNRDGNTLGTSLSRNPSISADGRYVTFDSFSNNLVADNITGRNIFVRDLVNGTTEIVSISSDGSQANGSSESPSISEDGRYITFLSDANNLVADDTNGAVDVFVRDLVNGKTYRANLNNDGTETSGLAETSSISGDGRYIAFQSAANNVTANDTDFSRDIFVRDRGEFFAQEENNLSQGNIPSLEINSLIQNTDSNEVTLSYSAFDADSQAEIKFFYDNDNQDFNGILITDDLIDTDGISTFTWNVEAEDVIPGDYYIYGMISDENNAYAFDYSEQKIQITEQNESGNESDSELIIDDSPVLNTPINRFQNNALPGTYLFAGASESQGIRGNFPNFVEEGQAFKVAVEPGDGLIRLNRFQNINVPGTYLYAGEQESQSIRANFPNFIEEGIAFYVYPGSADIGVDFYRFQNLEVPGTYIFVGAEERQNLLANFPNFVEEGVAFEVGI